MSTFQQALDGARYGAKARVDKMSVDFAENDSADYVEASCGECGWSAKDADEARCGAFYALLRRGDIHDAECPDCDGYLQCWTARDIAIMESQEVQS